ncbi:MAG: ammonium transporter [Caldilinea sp.]|nr:ammonium transporter [Caldilinea sp.]
MTEVTPASESHRRHDPEQIKRKRQGRRLSTLSRRLSTARTGRYLAFLLLTVTASLLPMVARGQGTPVAQAAPSAAPMFWYLLAAAMAMLVPVGLVLIGVAGLERDRAWNAALGAVAAVSLAGLAYWAVGFALQFGGIGLAYARPELRGLVWEWSPLPADWGVGWGVAGLSGWLLSGAEVTALVYALFLSHLPWLFTATLLPVMALRGRAPAVATLLIALLVGGVVYPLAGNWVQGGGWLAALGRNIALGHGFVDVGGAGTVFLLAAVFGLVALVVWAPRRSTAAPQLPPDYQPLLTVAGSLLLLAGVIGWLWANPLQVETLSDLGMMRGSVNIVLSAVAGALVPLLYTWFVSGHSHPTMAARGLAAGAVAGLAAAPFLQPGTALLTGFLAGATVPIIAYVLDNLVKLDDATGLVVTAGMPAIVGLLLAGIFADGAAGAGWQATGATSYLGVARQGVSGLFVAAGFQPDFPGQFQSQLIGIAAISIWGLVSGLVVCAPLGLLFYGLQRSERKRTESAAVQRATLPAETENALADGRRTYQ